MRRSKSLGRNQTGVNDVSFPTMLSSEREKERKRLDLIFIYDAPELTFLMNDRWIYSTIENKG
jgi:hypothetical protein